MLSRISNLRLLSLARVYMPAKVHSMQLGLTIFGMYQALFSAFGVETNGKRILACVNTRVYGL